ncbi:MAG TPA: hypothetical protein VNB67_03910 [Nitrososphaeraceae archaeon]|nr:hypothetical protein [Nitrososphaeraceae archaeon]
MFSLDILKATSVQPVDVKVDTINDRDSRVDQNLCHNEENGEERQ